MKTTWKIRNVKKTTKDEEYTELTLKDYRGTFVFKIDEPRYLTEDLDKVANYKGL
jgi:hypothetical protein